MIFWIRWASLHTKALVFAFIIGTLPVVAIGTLTYNFTNQSTRKEIIKYKQDKATILVENVNSFILRRYEKIQRLSQQKFIRNQKLKEVVNREQIQTFLNDNLEPESSSESISIFDINGELISSSKKESLPNQKKQEYFQVVLKTDKPYISQPLTTKSPDEAEIYLVAPVKDLVTGKTIYILRTVIPVKSLAKVVNIPQIKQDNYDFIDAYGKIFLSRTARHEGLNAQEEIPEWMQLQAKKQINNRFIKKSNDPEELVTYVPLPTLEDLSYLNWKLVLSTPITTALLTQEQLWLLLQIGVLVTALFVGGSAAIIANRLIQPVLATTMAVKKLGEGYLDTRISIKGSNEFTTLDFHINQMADKLQDLLQQRTEESEQLKLLTNTLLLMNSSLNYEDLFDITVKQARQGLKADRVVIYQLNPCSGGQVVAEGTAPGLPIALKDTIEDLINTEDISAYRKGRVLVTNNVHEAGFAPEQVLLMERLQIKASLIIPILNDQQLFGFLIAHYCFLPHIWQIHEINFLRQLATQLGMTLKRDDLLKQTKKEHLAAEVVYQEQRQHNKQIQEQLLQLLNDIEGVSRGDLTVRAEVPVGAIGTIADFLNFTVESLREIVTSVKLAATHVNIAVSENLGEFPQLAIKALKQADQISFTLNSVDKMTFSIQEVAKSATQAGVIASTASWSAQTGDKAMDMIVSNISSLREVILQTTKQIHRFGESSQQISRVLALVNEIAIQTNLLAINASVEASRAGEEAQGFAMIAEQVALLATETIAATFEMELILSGIQLENKELVNTMELSTLQVVEGSHYVQDTKESLNHIFDFCHQINELMQSISTRTVSQVQTSNEFTNLIKETIKVSEMTNNASRKVFTCLQKTVELSQELHASVSIFKIDKEKTYP
ncbi:MAG: methyl-accepting chemotaxis protein [Rhizonema sp. PD37]|nr:methyl-accepting chemotaxis protein [Rhizonema sp. PD37]